MIRDEGPLDTGPRQTTDIDSPSLAEVTLPNPGDPTVHVLVMDDQRRKCEMEEIDRHRAARLAEWARLGLQPMPVLDWEAVRRLAAWQKMLDRHGKRAA